jgi:hypothetical protein
VLQIRDNEFSGTLPVGMSALDTYDVTNNTFSGDIPTQIASMTSLQKLRLANNDLTGWIPS